MKIVGDTGLGGLWALKWAWQAFFKSIKLLRILKGGGCKVVAYADDVAIIFNGKYPQTLFDLMTAKLKILSEWTIANGLGVNPSKKELVLFTNRYKIPQFTPPI